MGESPIRRLGSAGSLCLTGVSEILQKVLIVLADLVLILFAAVALSKDWGHSCDENLHTYGFGCVVLCVLDLGWELVRCSLESALDRLQQEFQLEGGSPSLANNGNEGLLGVSPVNDAVVGSPSVLEGGKPDVSPARLANISAGVLGQGVRREKTKRQKRTNDLHFWSLVFTASVAIVFSFFSAHDEECAEKVPSLYFYIHAFTYVFIFRLGAIVMWVCCRTVKDYEDAAKDFGGIMSSGPASQQMATFSG